MSRSDYWILAKWQRNAKRIPINPRCGTRDLIFYTRDPEQAEREIEPTRGLTHTFNAGVEPDKHWELYRYFDQLISQSGSAGTKTSASA